MGINERMRQKYFLKVIEEYLKCPATAEARRLGRTRRIESGGGKHTYTYEYGKNDEGTQLELQFELDTHEINPATGKDDYNHVRQGVSTINILERDEHWKETTETSIDRVDLSTDRFNGIENETTEKEDVLNFLSLYESDGDTLNSYLKGDINKATAKENLTNEESIFDYDETFNQEISRINLSGRGDFYTVQVVGELPPNQEVNRKIISSPSYNESRLSHEGYNEEWGKSGKDFSPTDDRKPELRPWKIFTLYKNDNKAGKGIYSNDKIINPKNQKFKRTLIDETYRVIVQEPTE